MTITEEYDANDFLMGGGIPSAHAHFDKAPHGTTLTGTITVKPVVEQQRDLDTGKPKFWESDGKPMMQLVITLQTDLRNAEMHDDNGLRKLYVKGNLQQAIRTAVRAASAPGLAIGGVLTVTYVADGEQKARGKNPPKIYQATYVPPQVAAANEFLNGQHTVNDPGTGHPITPAQAATAVQAVFGQPAPAAPAQGFVPANQGPAPQWSSPAPAAPAAEGSVWTAPPGMDPQQAAALASLPPAQRAALGYP